MEALYPILPVAGRFVLVTALLMLLYWSVWRKQATYRAKRAYLITMPAVAIIIALLQVEVYKPAPIVVEVTSNELQAASESPTYSPLPDLFPREGVNSAEPLTASSEASTTHTESATYAAGSDTSLPSHEVGKEWGLPLIGLAYTLIILALFTPFVLSLYQVRRLRREASVRKDDSEHDIHILMGSVVKAPFSFYRTIFMPLALTEAQRRMIMEHERAHILHRHYIDVWVSETVTRLLWWNPFLWWARAELRNVHEFEADSEVLATGEDVLAYQTILIEEVLHGDVIIANGFNHSFIRRRFVEMLQTTNHRMTTWAKAGTAAWILLTAALMCCTVGEAETVYKTVTSEELQVTSDGAFNVGPKVVHFNHRNVVEKDLAKRDSLLWANAHSIPADFSIHIGMKSEEEQKLFERFMSCWFFIVDHNGWLERGEIPTHESLTEEEARNGIVKAKEHYRELLMQTLSQIDVPLRDTLNLFLEQFGTDFVLPKGKGFTVLYKQVNGEPKFYGRTPTPSNTASGANNQSAKSEAELLHEEEVITDDEGQWFDAVSISSKEANGVMSEMSSVMSEMFGTLYGSLLDQLQSLTQKQYDSLVSQLPPDTEVASLEEINKSIKTLKDSIAIAFKQTHDAKLKPSEEVEVPVITFTTQSIFTESIQDHTSAEEEVIYDEASLRVQDEALKAFFEGWFEMNEMAQTPILTEKEFQEALKTDSIWLGHFSSYEEYKDFYKSILVAASKKMDEAHARLNKEIRPQVEAAVKQHGKLFPPEQQLKFVIRAAYKNATWEFENNTLPGAYGYALTTNFEIVDDFSSSSKTSDEEFISPQWGLERPEGYVRLTDYKKQAETDAQTKQQYELLMKCINNAKAIFNKDLTDAYGDKHARYVEVEEKFFDKLQKVFDDARIGMLGLGAYRLPDGTIVIEDDRLNLMPQTVNWHKGTTQRDPRLRNKAPTMERDKSPNYADHNEQTWPVYTHVQTIDLETYNNQPQVFRGKDCTYVVEHFPIAYDFHWFYTNTQDKLVDTKTGDQYMKRYTEHFHMNNYMWIHGMKGEVIRLISIYPPLPKNVTSVDFIPSLIPDEIRLSNAAPRKDYKKLKVQELEQMEKVVY